MTINQRIALGCPACGALMDRLNPRLRPVRAKSAGRARGVEPPRRVSISDEAYARLVGQEVTGKKAPVLTVPALRERCRGCRAESVWPSDPLNLAINTALAEGRSSIRWSDLPGVLPWREYVS